jgi:hypothetical protein
MAWSDPCSRGRAKFEIIEEASGKEIEKIGGRTHLLSKINLSTRSLRNGITSKGMSNKEESLVPNQLSFQKETLSPEATSHLMFKRMEGQRVFKPSQTEDLW